MSGESYDLRISKMLVEAEPGLLACDPAATGRATHAVAVVMGSLLATVLAKKGEKTYTEALLYLVDKIDENARAVVEKAEHIIATDTTIQTKN